MTSEILSLFHIVFIVLCLFKFTDQCWLLKSACFTELSILLYWLICLVNCEAL